MYLMTKDLCPHMISYVHSEPGHARGGGGEGTDCIQNGEELINLRIRGHGILLAIRVRVAGGPSYLGLNCDSTLRYLPFCS